MKADASGTSAGARYRRIRRGVFDNSLRLFSFMRQFSPYQRAARRRCEQIRDVAYRPDGATAHRLDICRPKQRKGMLPVLMYIHGGGFVMCSKETHRGIGLIYADRGYVVFNINYRLAPKYKYPAALEDVAAAYRWIADNAARYGGDPDRIIVGGESAGGNLTLSLAVASCFKREEPAAKMIWDTGIVPRVIMVLCGMLQVSDPHHLKKVCPPITPIARDFALAIARDVSRAYLGREYRIPRSETALADPLLIMESNTPPARPLPTLYAMAGTHDILLDDTRRLEAAAKQRGLKNVVRYYAGEGHAFHLLGTSPQALDFWRDNLTFLEREMSRQSACCQPEIPPT